MTPEAPLPPGLSRRAFLRSSIALGTGATAAAFGAAQDTSPGTPSSGPSLPTRLPGSPSRVFVQHADAELVEATRHGEKFETQLARVSFPGPGIVVACPRGPLSRVVLRWEMRFPADTLFLGDHWERSYGDLQWRSLQPERIMPWYFSAFDPKAGRSFMAAVATQPAALCFWMVDAGGISLWLDFRNGGSPCVPGDREIAAATIVSFGSNDGENPMAALRRLCTALCPAPRRAKGPICGNNNWYYAYGRDFDADAMRRDAGFLAELAEGRKNRPYCVIDAGWTPGSSCPGGPWTKGDPVLFPDMPGLASDMTKLGVRPGIWVRPTALTVVDDARRLRPGPGGGAEKPLDLTLPENLSLAHSDISRIRSWGYELIKHDFSTYDALGRWGFQMGAELTDDGWHLADQSLTNAEIILRYYRTLRDAAGDAVLLGCNTVGHLAAGLFEIQRTGDDTSGRIWERTRRMGINTLAFRLPQHGTFFENDADCAAHTASTPWELDRQFLDLVSRSGTALFISADPRTVSPAQKAVFRDAMQRALSREGPVDCEPVDWIHSTTPTEWRFGDQKVSYDWTQPFGTWPMRV